MSDYTELYMEAFVAAVDRPAKAKGFKKGEFAATVWKDTSPAVAINRWQNMRTKSHITGLPQVVTLPDGLKMTEVLGADLPYVLLQAKLTADEKFAIQHKEAPESKIFSKKQAPKPPPKKRPRQAKNLPLYNICLPIKSL